MAFEKLAEASKIYGKLWEKSHSAMEKDGQKDNEAMQKAEDYYNDTICMGKYGAERLSNFIFWNYRDSIEKNKNDIICLDLTIYGEDYKQGVFDALDYWEIDEFVFYNDTLKCKYAFELFKDLCNNGWKMDGMKEINVKNSVDPNFLWQVNGIYFKRT